MTTYPAIIPSSREFGPGKYPHTIFRAMSGEETSVRHSSAMIESPVELRYSVLDEAEMIEILDHYDLVKGGFLPFAVPTIVWSGNENANEFTLPGNAWRYARPPEVEEVFCGGGTGNSGAGYIVVVTLESIPGEGVGLLGPQFRVRSVFTPGKAAAANGPQFVVKATLSFGRGIAPGAAFTATSTFTPGTATGGTGVTIFPAFFAARVQFRPGTALEGTARLFTIKPVFTAAKAVAGPGPEFSKVAVLIHGWNGLKDDSFNGRSLTVGSAAELSSVNPRFGSESISLTSVASFPVGTIIWGNVVLARPWTIEAWIWSDNFGASNYICTQDPLGNAGVDDNFRVTTDRRLQIRTGGDAEDFLQSSPSVIQSSTWHHVAATVDETTLRLFVDGVIVASKSRPSNLTYSFTAGKIGAARMKMQEFRATTECLYTEAFDRPLQTFTSLAGVTHATVDGVAEAATATFNPGTATGA